MSKFRHPFKYLYWRYRLRGKLRVTVDLKKSQPIDVLANRQQKVILSEFMAAHAPKVKNG